ncbi:DUF6236 family protein [Pseudomonas sp. B21-044]|uniref:DUF6236 family protein n=1 Tax=Pseudomonas sp. B21-044 TaxID=2895488 RepID=UPI0021606068|nr:DUF6236 family protein [Pseudomonas sp. B21-044]UVL19618.1 DUF6236 family protein [Pseudomonas sp. B21-044]
MGEAKYRKANDPNYGKPKKAGTVRGLILSPPVTINGDSVSTRGGLDTQDLRFALTYWDRLALPDNNIISFGAPPEAQYLEDCGILRRPLVRFSGNASGAYAVYHTQELALTLYEEEDEGSWSIHEGVNSVKRAGDEAGQDGTLIQLLNAVPVPGPDVPLAEILEFKAKRRDELLRFREYFDALSSNISSSDTLELELANTLKEIDESCADLLKVTREWQFPVKLSDTKAYLNIDIGNAFKAAGSTYAACLKSFGLSQTSSVIAAAGAAVTSQVKLEPAPALQNIKRPRSPYKYAYLVRRDLQ